MSKYLVIAYFLKERFKEQHMKEPRGGTHMSQLGTSLGFDQAEKFSLPQWLCKEFRKQLVPTLLLLCPPPTIGK